MIYFARNGPYKTNYITSKPMVLPFVLRLLSALCFHFVHLKILWMAKGDKLKKNIATDHNEKHTIK
jgi:hypothetical protein